MAQWADYQIHQCYSFYPSMVQEPVQGFRRYKIPIQIAISSTPLHLRVDCLGLFPQAPP